jgi:hypothetical protein
MERPQTARRRFASWVRDVTVTVPVGRPREVAPWSYRGPVVLRTHAHRHGWHAVTLVSAVTTAASLGVFQVARAQRPQGERLILGRVTDTLGAPLSYCFVRFAEASSAVMCDSAGGFRLAGVGNGPTTFEVRRLGYAPGRFTAVVVRDSSLFTIQLVPLPTVVRPLTVTASSGPVLDPWLVEHGYYERMRAGVAGTFITPEALRRLNPQRVTQALQDQPGIRITYSAGRLSSGPIPLVWGRNFCLLNVFVDGMEVKGVYTIPEGVRRGGVSFYGSPGWTGGGAESIGGTGIDAFLQPAMIAAMEVYPSGAGTPNEFRTTNECGAIVIWTKIGTSASGADSAANAAAAADTARPTP